MEDLKVCRCSYGNSFLELDEEKIPEEHGNESRSVMSDSLPPHGLYRPWNCLGQNTGVGSLSLLQGTFPNPGIKPKSPALQSDSLPAEPQGIPPEEHSP